MAEFTTAEMTLPADVRARYETEAAFATLPIEGFSMIRITQEAIKDGLVDPREFDSATVALEKLADLFDEVEVLTRDQLIEISLLVRGLSQFATTVMVPDLENTRVP